MLDCGVDAKIIEKAGSWYSFNGDRIGQGRENVKNYLAEHPQTLEKVEQMLRDQLKAETEAKAEDVEAAEADLQVDEDGVIIE